MRIINVIEILDGVIENIESFGVLSQDVVDKAEALFEAKCREFGYDEDDNIAMENLIEDGCFCGGNFSICLTWSEI
jgi:hypothetical protein